MVADVQNFEHQVIERSATVPVVVDFWAEWCSPCKVLGPILERLETTSGGTWELAKVDTDKNQSLAVRYGVKGIPTVKLFVSGRVAAEFTGALAENAVAGWLVKNLPDPSRHEVDAAETLFREGHAAKASELLESLVRRDVAHPRARALLALLLVPVDRARAAALVAGIEGDSEAFPFAEAVRTVRSLAERASTGDLPEDTVRPTYSEGIAALLSNDYTTALNKFIEVIRRNRYYDDDGARKACIAVFKILGDDHVLTHEKRREFSSALY